MLDTLGSLFDWLDGIAIVACGIGYLWLWRQHRFWLPRYAHYLAAGATFVAALGIWFGRSTEEGLGNEALLVPLMPFAVYLVLIFYGGAEAARARHERSKRND